MLAGEPVGPRNEKGQDMAEFDTLIKGGTVVDGIRVPRYRADIGIKDGRIAQIGGIRGGDADTVLDAGGQIVAPGFVDLHTHYDAQIQWDPYCTLSGWHGVTSVALGNCGFGFAPVRPEERERAMVMMSRNEAIPLETMQTGMLWDWVTFPEFLDSLDRIPKGVNCLSYVPLSPLMIWVMGLEAAKSRPPTEDERGEMRRLLGEGMDAGGCGWSIQRLGAHSIQADYDGTPMPTDTMTDEHVLALGEVLRERDAGLIQITQATVEGEFTASPAENEDYRFVEQLAQVSGRPILFNIVFASDANPEFHRQQMRWLENANARGLPVFGQGMTHHQSMSLTMDDWNFFDSSPAWNKATTGTHAEKLQKLADPELRAQMKAEEHLLLYDVLGGPIDQWIVQDVGNRPEFERYRGRTVEDVAKEEGKDALDVVLDIAVGSDLRAVFRTDDMSSGDPDKVSELMLSPYTMPGVSDGGAHMKFLLGGVFTTDFLTWLVRDTGKLTLEEAHYRLSTLPAHAGGFKDRGYLREGMAADIVVYDLDNLKCVPERPDSEIVHDLPGGEWRRVQRAEGYRWTLVNGVVTFENGECTGATPGALLRHGRAAR